jgi:hypothetical protein
VDSSGQTFRRRPAARAAVQDPTAPSSRTATRLGGRRVDRELASHALANRR